ncbi:DUF3558 domain-containing protein [Nocardia cyriacigeorgica]|uniref:DUF3558 domain-containing protein n=2 Tax=Nocardia cyriacigeorgica TaxID=135487 RepID=A0A6P1D510_9NOCA|nr:DUF3558 domain-containing protein [Nocardia cyriacigeorgica]
MRGAVMTGGGRRVRAMVAVAAAMGVTLTLSGCGRTVEGSAQPAGAAEASTVNTDFDKLLRECDVVTQDQIAKVVDETSMVMPSFYGAVCMWDLEGGATGSGMVSLNWYEIGSLNNERANNDKLGYTTATITVQGRSALETRRPGDPDSCGVSASAADTGIIGWWVNYRAGSAHPDPCGAAKKLVELTLNLAR